MSQQRGHQAQNQSKAAESQQQDATVTSGKRPEDAIDAVQELLGTRAASRQLRAEAQQEGAMSQSQPLHQLVRSLSPVSPRSQGKPAFRGVSHEWGGASSGLVVQPKLTIGEPNDPYEQEADRVSQQVMNMPAAATPQAVQREAMPEEEELQTKPLAPTVTPLVQRETLPEDDELQMKPVAEQLQREVELPDDDELQMKSVLQRETDPEEEDELQMKPAAPRSPDGRFQAGANLESQLNQSRGGGSPLSEEVRSFMEPRFGADFSQVKVHTDAQADQLNRSIQAKAFTTGHDIFFRQGAYQPRNQAGQELIAHELTHVMQQNGRAVQRSSIVQRVYEPKDRGVTVHKIIKMKNCWYKAAIALITKKIEDAVVNGSEDRQTNLKTLQTEVRKAKLASENMLLVVDRPVNVGTDDGKNEMEQLFPQKLSDDLADKISKANKVKKGTPRKQDEKQMVKEELRNAYIRILNNETKWAPIVNVMNFGKPDAEEHYTSTITPVNENYHETYGTTQGGKGYGQTGLSSMSTPKRLTNMTREEKNRTTNLAYTELRAGKDPKGEVLFAGFRSGALAGKKGDKDIAPGAKAEALRANTLELLQAMVIKYLNGVNEDERQSIFAGKAAEIKVFSTNLQSVLAKEGGMIDNQLAALRKFDKTENRNTIIEVLWRKGETGQLEKKQITVNFDIVALNLGVNAQGTNFFNRDMDPGLGKLDRAVQAYLGMSEKTKKGLRLEDNEVVPNAVVPVAPQGRRRAAGTASAENAEATTRLPAENALKIKEIERKNKKILQLWEEVKTAKGASGSYELTSRIANLAFLLGYMVHYNCKSGKDRTGMQDVETKFLALRMHRAEKAQKDQFVPKHDVSEEVREDYQRMLFESGNLEMQAYNTGGQGYKIAPTTKKQATLPTDAELQVRVGGAAVLKQLQGLMDYTNE